MKSSLPFPPPFAESAAPQFGSVNEMFAVQFEALEDRILHHCDRPLIEMSILSFLEHALGPTSEGIANAMGIGAPAALVHLENLRAFGRVWRATGNEENAAWHISNVGRRYLHDHPL